MITCVGTIGVNNSPAPAKDRPDERGRKGKQSTVSKRNITNAPYSVRQRFERVTTNHPEVICARDIDPKQESNKVPMVIVSNAMIFNLPVS